MMVMIQLFSWQLWLLMMIHIDFMIFPIRPWDPWDCLQSQVAGQVEIGRPAVRLEASSRRQTWAMVAGSSWIPKEYGKHLDTPS